MTSINLRMNTVSRIVFLVLIALISLSEPVLILVFFVPIVGWFVWRDQDRISKLEKRLADLEPHPQPMPKPQET